jgi:hypothetical protein
MRCWTLPAKLGNHRQKGTANCTGVSPKQRICDRMFCRFVHTADTMCAQQYATSAQHSCGHKQCLKPTHTPFW